MKYGNISEIAQYNRENGTNFYTMEQVEKHKRKNSAEEFEKKHPFLASLSKSAQDARDARVGAIGAGQVRDLYNKGENELASELTSWSWNSWFCSRILYCWKSWRLCR